MRRGAGRLHSRLPGREELNGDSHQNSPSGQPPPSQAQSRTAAEDDGQTDPLLWNQASTRGSEDAASYCLKAPLRAEKGAKGEPGPGPHTRSHQSIEEEKESES